MSSGVLVHTPIKNYSSLVDQMKGCFFGMQMGTSLCGLSNLRYMLNSTLRMNFLVRDGWFSLANTIAVLVLFRPFRVLQCTVLLC